MDRSAVLTGDVKVWRTEFTGWLKKRFLLRFHMSLILMLTFVTGILATKVLLEIGLNRLWMRYAIAVLAGYAAFLGAMRIWLWYVGRAARRTEEAERGNLPPELFDAMFTIGDLDLLDGAVDVASSGGRGAARAGGGGRFGGGGATGSWEGPPPLHAAAMASRSASKGGSGGSSPSFSFDIDDGAVLAVLALVAVLAIAGGYLIYAAPGIMAEAAFDGVLAAALVRRAKRVDSPGWVGSVMRATAIPFIAILAVSIFAGWYAQRACPSATRLSEALDCATAPAPAGSAAGVSE